MNLEERAKNNSEYGTQVQIVFCLPTFKSLNHFAISLGWVFLKLFFLPWHL